MNTTQQKQTEKIQALYKGEETVTVYFGADSVLVSKKEHHELGKQGMISLNFHETQTILVEKILGNYKLVTIGVSSHDYTKIGHNTFSTEITMYFSK